MRALVRGLIALLVGPALFTGAAAAQDQVGGGAVAPEAPLVKGPAPSSVPGKIVKDHKAVELRDGQIARSELIEVAVPADNPTVIYTLTNAGGTIFAAHLQHERYQRDKLPEIPGVPEEKRAAGPIDVVSTWSPRFLPYRLIFKDLAVPTPITRVVRKAAGGTIKEGRIVAPTLGEREQWAVDRPLKIGDTLVIEAPASVAGEYKINALGHGGSIEPSKPFAAADITGLKYEVKRVGAAKDLFEQDPTFTRVSDTPGFPLVYVWPDPNLDTSSFFIEKRFEAGSHPYELALTVVLHNVGDKTLRSHLGLRVSAWQHPGSLGGHMFARPTNVMKASCRTNESLEEKDFNALHKEAIENLSNGQAAVVSDWFTTPTDWVAVGPTYFMNAAIPITRAPTGQCQLGLTVFDPNTPGAWSIYSTYFTSSVLQLTGSANGCVPTWLEATHPDAPRCAAALDTLGVSAHATRKEIEAAWSTLRSGGGDVTALDTARDALMGRRRATYRFKIFQGPKDYALLAETGGQPLRESLSLGIFGFISKPLHQLLVWLHGGVGSWALAIILLTIIIKMVLLPLTNKSYRSMQKMQQLKPKLDELKKRLGDDKQKFAAEQMALFKREGVNPLGGCLPMILQMPVWFGLYRTIYSSVELYHAPMGLWIHDLSAPDPYFVLPIVLGGLMFVQTLLTTSTGAIEGMQGKLLKFGMPIMFSVFMLFLPAGLVLYILVNVLLTIGQNVFIRRRMGVK